ncbi:hypothetical protein N0V93_003982 [Gnomoniopsis smithogilvyi]|uniref:Acyltransferase 3 domain-containing protein n=1 Tax=Gnomoniopsis smithogilvyi TaxID=1191159 RepID=A0A9W8Z1H1_9PEZI|nr:hypothetical protein N0V93_003982 [Gnomoniopsis smithogilvyi]
MERIQWIDGLRGLAAFSVCSNHIIYGEITAPYRSFWDSPAHENRKLIQLPPLRLLFASKGMVPLFMVLGSYTISLGLIKSRQSLGLAALCHRVQSIAIRRFMRLYAPVLLLVSVAQTLYFFDLFSWDFGAMGVLRGREPFQRPISHITYAFRLVMDLMDIVEFQFSQGFSNQIWTIPYEFRGSLVVCLLTLIFSGCKTHLRLSALAAISAHLFWYGHWDLFCFVAGQFLAEAKVASSKKIADRREHGIWQLVLLIAGIYLLCLRSETELPHEYRFLVYLESPYWNKHNPWIDVQYSWHAIASLLVVGAISSSASYQRQLERRIPQYLGRLSFSMYLVHEVVYRLWRNPLRDFFWSQCRDGMYPGTDVAYEDPVPFFVAWIGAGLTLGLVTVLAAEVYHHLLDQRIVALARTLDIWATTGRHDGNTAMGMKLD